MSKHLVCVQRNCERSTKNMGQDIRQETGYSLTAGSLGLMHRSVWREWTRIVHGSVKNFSRDGIRGQWLGAQLRRDGAQVNEVLTVEKGLCTGQCSAEHEWCTVKKRVQDLEQNWERRLTLKSQSTYILWLESTADWDKIAIERELVQWNAGLMQIANRRENRQRFYMSVTVDCYSSGWQRRQWSLLG